MKIVLTRRLPGSYTKVLIDHYDEVVVMEEGRPLRSSELKTCLEGAHVALCQLTDVISASVIPKSLMHLITYSVGVNHIDLEVLKKNNISLSYTPDILTEATADCAFGLILCASRKFKEASLHLREGHFNGFGPEDFLGVPVGGATLGIVGMGRIGLAVAKRAIGFGMKILYDSPKAMPQEIEETLSAKKVNLEVLLKESDIVSLHCPLKKETRFLLDAEKLKWMKPNAVLVNTARGALIEEKALIHHLKNHPEFSAGIDVYEKEPEVSEELLGLKNCFCLPHIGSADCPTRELMAKTCIEEAIRFAKGEPLQYLFAYP